MKRGVLVPGLLGGLVALVWMLISNTMIPMKSNLVHQIAPNQLELHAALKENITEPGTYSIPSLPPDQQASFPDYQDQPVYSVTYSGYTHGQPGSPADIVTPIAIIFLVAFLAAWILSMTSQAKVSSYGKKVAFVTLLGIVIALHDDVLQMFFGPQPRDYLVYLAINNVLTWFWMGLVIAWKSKPNAG